MDAYSNQTPSGASSASASSASFGASSALRMPTTPPLAPSSAQAASTEPFLRDFTLIAEAAKRAQMAILTRDMDGFSF